MNLVLAGEVWDWELRSPRKIAAKKMLKQEMRFS
jgi:hypothetical protein